MAIIQPQTNGVGLGVSVPSTNVWDTDQIHNLEEESAQLKELLIRLYQNLNRLSTVVNIKESGYFNTLEFVSGAQWFPNPASTDPAFFSITRPERRLVLFPGALPNAGILTIPHNIVCTTATSFVHMYGTATNSVSTFSYIPIPYSSTTSVNDNIELYADGTNVYIKTASDYSAYTVTYIVLEYLQQ